MDSTLIVSIVIAVVAIVPGVWALVNQANKDKSQSKRKSKKAAATAWNHGKNSLFLLQRTL